MLSILQYHRFVLFFFGNSVFLSCGLMECAERWISLHMIYKSLSCSIFEYQILEVHKTINFEARLKNYSKIEFQCQGIEIQHVYSLIFQKTNLGKHIFCGPLLVTDTVAILDFVNHRFLRLKTLRLCHLVSEWVEIQHISCSMGAY